MPYFVNSSLDGVESWYQIEAQLPVIVNELGAIFLAPPARRGVDYSRNPIPTAVDRLSVNDGLGLAPIVL